MTHRFLSPLSVPCVAVSALWFTTSAIAQDYPPAPPVALQIVTEQAPEPTLAGPRLLGAPLPEVAPLPADFLPPDPNMAVPEADVEAFARGQVHEAFADVYELDPAPSVIVTVAPPTAVDELPPEDAPTGDNVQWISGYWGWDTEATDYIWVSGVWRDVPPGRRWVPGYWAEVAGGFQWVSGFWSNAESQELAYVPQPPASLEVGPNVPPPSDDQVWVPGNWTYVSNDYRWSPGYYTPCQTDYMWIPNQYNWTPRGCVYIPGYWDYRFARRGTLFSPVRFRRSLVSYGYGRPACYQPRYSVNMSSFLIHLFVRPRNRCFYYGDYYGQEYAGQGYTPWYRRTMTNRRLYDPAYNFYCMDSRRQGLDFDRTVNTWHQRYESNRDIRPPRLIQDQSQFLARHTGDRTAQLAVMTNRFEDMVKNPQAGHTFHKMERKEIDLLRENNQVTRDLETARRHLERDSNIVRTGDTKPGELVDLRLKDIRDRAGREGQRGDAPKAANGQPDLPSKLVLTDLPERLKAKTRESAATLERMRLRAAPQTDTQPSTGKPLDTIRERAAERALARDQATNERERDKAARSGNTQPLIPPTVEDGSKPVVNDRSSGLPDLSNTKGATDAPNRAAARLEELRQKGEERRNSRDAGPPAPGVEAAKLDTPAGQPPRIIEGGPLKNPLGESPVLGQPARGTEDSVAKQRVEELRQKVQEQRATFDARNAARRAAPTPGEVESRPPRVIDRAPQNDIGGAKVGAVRERPLMNRNDNPAPVVRQPPVEQVPRNIERQAPVERPARTERAPVQQAPRQIERQVPVERAPAREIERRAPVERAPVERAPRGEREAPRRRGRD